ncbi:hypothetical protein Fmac_019162 [Flemingia macrophylla]|uniref:Uncharacterized protein n=1 Tax=Flemingia macrophylla TaxID=520843 RepID=A0ABD1M726_9FABA
MDTRRRQEARGLCSKAWPWKLEFSACQSGWSIIASHLPERTDNEIKNYWNTNIKKRLIRMGLDPITHKPKPEAYDVHQTKNNTNMNHMAQWENARLEAEARESMLQVGSSFFLPPQLVTSKIPIQPCFSSDSPSTKHNTTVYNMCALTLVTNHDLQSPVSTLSFPDNKLTVLSNVGQFTDTESSLSYKVDGNVKQSSSQTQKMMESYYEPILQDDDIMMAVEAFRSARCESIHDLFNNTAAMEGLIDCSSKRYM